MALCLVQDLWYNDALSVQSSLVQMQVIILGLLSLWQLTETFKERRTLFFVFNLAINFFFFHVEREQDWNWKPLNELPE